MQQKKELFTRLQKPLKLSVTAQHTVYAHKSHAPITKK